MSKAFPRHCSFIGLTAIRKFIDKDCWNLKRTCNTVNKRT